MVMIQVLIAQVTLSDTEEFGVELGLQDGLLFDRSAAITSTTTGTSLVPGYPFNNQPLGNSPPAPPAIPRLTMPPWSGTQGLSNFALGRTRSHFGIRRFCVFGLQRKRKRVDSGLKRKSAFGSAQPAAGDDAG